MSETAKEYYRRIYDLKSKKELIEEVIRLNEVLNVREAIKADSQWISKYKELNKNLYLLNDDLVVDNQNLKIELEQCHKDIDFLLEDIKDLRKELEEEEW